MYIKLIPSETSTKFINTLISTSSKSFVINFISSFMLSSCVFSMCSNFTMIPLGSIDTGGITKEDSSLSNLFFTISLSSLFSIKLSNTAFFELTFHSSNLESFLPTFLRIINIWIFWPYNIRNIKIGNHSILAIESIESNAIMNGYDTII